MDVLDRVLDKGVVIDAWVRLSVVGIDLITLEARVVVASIETYLHHSAALADAGPAARPSGDPHRATSLAEALGLPSPVASVQPVPTPLPPVTPRANPRPRLK